MCRVKQEREGKMKTIDFKGRPYVEVKERVKEFHKLHPNGSIVTEIFRDENEKVIMKATVTPDVKVPERFFTGTAYEKESNKGSFVNGTSYIENCETSAVGRAMGFLGIGIDAAIASLDEVQKVSKDQLSRIMDLVADITVKKIAFDEAKFLKYMKVDELQNITGQDFQKAVSALDEKLKKAGVK